MIDMSTSKQAVEWQVAERILWNPYAEDTRSAKELLAPMFAPITLVDAEHPEMRASVLGTRYDASIAGDLEKAKERLANGFTRCLEIALWKHTSANASPCERGTTTRYAWMSEASGTAGIVIISKMRSRIDGTLRHVMPDGVFYSNPGAASTLMFRTPATPNGFDTRIMEGVSPTARMLVVQCVSMIQFDKAIVFYEPDAIPVVQ